MITTGYALLRYSASTPEYKGKFSHIVVVSTNLEKITQLKDQFRRRIEIATGYIEKDPESKDWSVSRIRSFKTEKATFKVVCFKK